MFGTSCLVCILEYSGHTRNNLIDITLLDTVNCLSCLRFNINYFCFSFGDLLDVHIDFEQICCVCMFVWLGLHLFG